MLSRKKLKSRNAAIYKGFVNGMTPVQLSAKYSLRVQRIRQIIKSVGGLSLSDVRRQRNILVVKDFQDGLTEEKISNKYRITTDYVISILTLGIKKYRSPRPRRVKEQTIKIIEAHKRGKSIEEIAQEFGFTVQWVRHYLAACGRYMKLGRSPKVMTQRERGIATAISKNIPLHLSMKKYGVGPGTIRKIANEYGCQAKYRKMLAAMKEQAIVDVIDGASESQIAEKYWLTPTLTARLMKAAKKIVPKK